MDTKETNFVKTIFGSFFRWWWAVLTGIATLFSLAYIPETLTFKNWQFAIVFLVVSFLLFFALSTTYQGWLIFRNRSQVISVSGFNKSNSYDNEFVFIIKGLDTLSQGKLVELRRVSDGVEVTFAVVEIRDLNSSNSHQANPIFILPGHLRDLRTNKFSVSEIIVDSAISSRALELYKKEILGS